VSIPITGNGDVIDPLSAKRLLDETGCDGIMIGRAAQGNPWIFKRVVHYLKTGEILPEPDMQERINGALKHFRALIVFKGEFTAVREMRRHLPCYIKGINGGAKIRAAIVLAESFEEMRGIMESCFL
jgi:tRNA-dihydrouridine synthase